MASCTIRSRPLKLQKKSEDIHDQHPLSCWRNTGTPPSTFFKIIIKNIPQSLIHCYIHLISSKCRNTAYGFLEYF